MNPPAVTACPICEGIFELEDLELDVLTDCPDCGETFRVASLDPLRLVYAYDADEEAQDLDEPYSRT